MTYVAGNDWPGSFPTASMVGCIYGLVLQNGDRPWEGMVLQRTSAYFSVDGSF